MDNIEALLDWGLNSSNFSSHNSSDYTSEFDPLPYVIESAVVGFAGLLSLVGAYGNLVLARTLFKSTLLASSHRRLIRFFCYFHVALGVSLSVIAIAWLFRWITWAVLPAPTVLFLLFREGVRTCLTWCCLERILYNKNEKVREDRGGKILLLIRLAVIIFSVLFTTFMGLYIGGSTPEGLFPAFAFNVSLMVETALPIPMIILLIFLISRVENAHKWSQGLVATVRVKKLEQEKGSLRNCIIPLTFFISVCSGIEILVNLFAESYIVPTTFLIYSARILIWPLGQLVLQPLLRDDCRMNLFIWRKLQRRSSEARVRTIMNKESQESIISNFKMIGILSD